MSKTLTQRIQEVLEKLDPMILENVWTLWFLSKLLTQVPIGDVPWVQSAVPLDHERLKLPISSGCDWLEYLAHVELNNSQKGGSLVVGTDQTYMIQIIIFPSYLHIVVKNWWVFLSSRDFEIQTKITIALSLNWNSHPATLPVPKKTSSSTTRAMIQHVYRRMDSKKSYSSLAL